jgi:hypothetical protein
MEADEEQKEKEKKEKKEKELLVRLRRVVGYFHRASTAKEALINAQVAIGIPKSRCVSVIQDVCTRWGSALSMIDRYLQLHGFVSAVLLNAKKKV